MKSILLFVPLLTSLFISSVGFSKVSISLNNLTQNSVPESLGSVHSYNFGVVFVNTMSTVRYIITNTGDQPLKFNSANIYGIYYRGSHSCTQGLNPGQKCDFQIQYWPAAEGLHSGDFKLNFLMSDNSLDTIQVQLWGQARQR